MVRSRDAGQRLSVTKKWNKRCTIVHAANIILSAIAILYHHKKAFSCYQIIFISLCEFNMSILTHDTQEYHFHEL